MHTSTAQNAERPKVPPILLKGVAFLVLASLAMVTAARIAGLQPAATPDDSVAVVSERLIEIKGRPDGGATVVTSSGELIVDLGPEKAGFVGGVKRSLDRERMLHKAPVDAPVRIVQFADGRLALRDPATDWRIELMSFGKDNREAFAALLPDAR